MFHQKIQRKYVIEEMFDLKMSHFPDFSSDGMECNKQGSIQIRKKGQIFRNVNISVSIIFDSLFLKILRDKTKN